MKNIDAYTHTRGESIYLDDIPEIAGTLYAACFDSPLAHGNIKYLDTSAAASSEGVVRVLTFRDIPGINQIGGIIADEELLAAHQVHFCGMPVALVIATTVQQARAALKKIRLEVDPLPVITDPRVAAGKGELIVPPRSFSMGDCSAAWRDCDFIYEGQANSNGQEHLYIETQGAYAIPGENGVIKIYSSTQSPTAVQRAISKVTGLPMHMLEVEVTRLGGGFGGKEDQANTWAALCALATNILKRPVKYALSRMEDMRMTGKRHPYSSDFKIGLSKALKIIAYDVTFYQNAGAAADLSPAIMERTLFHCTNTYFVPNARATVYSCRTNLPPNTAFRGFGGPQGMFVMECAIATAAEHLGITAAAIQHANLLQTGDELLYGQKVLSEASACWEKAVTHYQLDQINKEVSAFNNQHRLQKKGVALMPICFGISFTNTTMNQARALVHIYTDGSVLVNTGAIEMGQGVNTRIVQVAAQTLGILPGRIKINSTNTSRIANTSPSAASATADLNGHATRIACNTLLNRLKTVAAAALNVEVEVITIREERVYVGDSMSLLDWTQLVLATYNQRVSLSEHAHYATPGLHFNKALEKGHPFAYHVFGTAITTVTVDCLRGTYEVDAVRLVHDAGNSMNPLIDLGQVEGGLVQGIGWMTMEEVVYDAEGKLRSNALSTYKVPDIYSVPKIIEVKFLETAQDNPGILRSKAVGEPPLMYGIGTYFAIRNALRHFKPGTRPAFDAPMTPEKLLINLYPEEAAALDIRQQEIPGLQMLPAT